MVQRTPEPASSSPGGPARLRRRCHPRPGDGRRRRVPTAVSLLLGTVLVLAAVTPTGAQTAGPGVAEADAEVAALRARADEQAGAYFAALGRLADLQRQADEVEARLPAIDAERSRLRALANERAVTAYKRSGNGTDLGLVFDAADPLDAARRSQLLDQLNALDAAVVRQLRAATERLQAQRAQLRDARAEAAGALDAVRAQGAEIDRLLTDARARRDAAVAAATTTTTSTTSAARVTPTTRPPGGGPVVPPTTPPGYVPTPGVHPRHDEPFLVCTRTREASGNYGAVNPAGPYLGAYQFLQSTWNSVANHSGRTGLIGVPPNLASPYDQDDLAWTMYEWQGAGPWGGLCTDA